MPKIITDEKLIDEILNRGTIVEILPKKDEFKKRLLKGEKLKFYIGFDATAPTLHLSHAKNFILLEKFRKLGHEVIVLFGDFTARIGDPTGQDSARKQLSKKDVDTNVKKWKEQIKPLMDFDDEENPPKIMYNSKWLSRLDFEDILNLSGNFTVQQIIERDMFQKRLKDKKPIYLNEFLYPLMQGYDSVAMDVDVEICGTDQIFNALIGRTLLKKLKEKEKFIVAVTLMENPKTGELMSKSKGTGVFLNFSANDMFGQIMAQPDEMMETLFINCTYLPLFEIKEILKSENPKDAKIRLAYEIIKIFYKEKKAKLSKEEFLKVFSKKEKPTDIEEFKISKKEISLVDLLSETKLVNSKTNARRLIEQGGVRVDDEVKKDIKEVLNLKGGEVVQVGKRRFLKILQKLD